MFQQLRTSSSSSCRARVAAVFQQRRRASSDRTPLTAPPAEALRPESVPRHVAVVMDGNSRWARARGLPPTVGHEHGLRALEGIARLSRAWGVRVLTAFAFSHENWNRPKPEVDFLMVRIQSFIHDNVDDFSSQGIRLRVIGDHARLPVFLQNTVREAEEATKENSQLDLVLAMSYSGRRDIVQACRNLAHKVHEKVLRPEDIDETLFANELQTSLTDEFPYPDLLIRTSGELRLSNFLLWQTAYSELFFTDTLWPDFGEADYLEALRSFHGRDRRFGKRNMILAQS
uniref:Uncharacterized protein n=1 Tax=Avena sativa TaxID=4498 RepID=A0ACD5WBV9_AVESA